MSQGNSLCSYLKHIKMSFFSFTKSECHFLITTWSVHEFAHFCYNKTLQTAQLNHRNLSSYSSRGRKTEVQVLADLVLWGPWGGRTCSKLSFFLCLPVIIPLSMSVPKFSFLIRTLAILDQGTPLEPHFANLCSSVFNHHRPCLQIRAVLTGARG
jgi:hypothetical protein